MNKFMNFLEKYFMPFAGKMAGQRHLQALRDGIVLAMPLIIIGSIFLIIAFLPIPGYDDFMMNTFGGQWRDKLLYPQAATFGMMGLIACFGIAYRLAEKYDVDAVSAGAIALCAFLLVTPFTVMFTPEGVEEAVAVGGAIPVALMGSSGLFVAMLIALFSTEVYRFIIQKNIVIKLPEGVPPAVSKSFVALIPGFVVIVLVWLIRLLVESFDINSIHDIVTLVLGKPLGLLGETLVGSVIAVALVQLLWSAGLHGMNIVGSVMSPVWLENSGENLIAFQAGEALPHVFTSTFFDVFVNIGGSGATFGLVILMLLWAKSQQMKQLGKLSVGPGLFMINEPIVFGMPIVMNPLLIIPFFLVPIVNVITTYFAMELGIVAKPSGVVIPWTTPPIIGGFLATNHFSGSLMQLFNIVVGFMIYLPFFKMWDNLKKKEETAAEQI